MALSEQDRELFYKLLTPLHFYANFKLSLFSNYTTLEDFKQCPVTDRMIIRNKILEDPSLIDQFIHDNPEGFNQDELDIVRVPPPFSSHDMLLLTHFRAAARLAAVPDQR